MVRRPGLLAYETQGGLGGFKVSDLAQVCYHPGGVSGGYVAIGLGQGARLCVLFAQVLLHLLKWRGVGQYPGFG